MYHLIIYILFGLPKDLLDLLQPLRVDYPMKMCKYNSKTMQDTRHSPILIEKISCKYCQVEINSTCYCGFGHTFCSQNCLQFFLLIQIQTEKDPTHKLFLESLLVLIYKT